MHFHQSVEQKHSLIIMPWHNGRDLGRGGGERGDYSSPTRAWGGGGGGGGGRGETTLPPQGPGSEASLDLIVSIVNYCYLFNDRFSQKSTTYIHCWPKYGVDCGI